MQRLQLHRHHLCHRHHYEQRQAMGEGGGVGRGGNGRRGLRKEGWKMGMGQENGGVGLSK